MKIILLLITLICTLAGIYFDQIVVTLGSFFVFYVWTLAHDYDQEPTAHTYIELLLLLMCTGLIIYVIIGLVKDALSMAKELLGPQPDFLYYLMVIALYLTLFVAGKLLSKKIRKLYEK